MQIIHRQISLHRCTAREEFGTEHALQKPTLRLGGQQHAIARDEEVGKAALGEEAFGVGEQNLKSSRSPPRVVIKGPVTGFVVQAKVRSAPLFASRSRNLRTPAWRIVADCSALRTS